MVNALWIDDGTGPVRNPDLTDDEFAAGLATLQSQNVQALWQKATDYQEAQISGAAYGLVTLGVIKQTPKALAVMAWINSVWALYYQRKPLVTHEWDGALFDFSTCGPMPCTVPELMAEVAGG
jgi:hypothetical protein